MTIYKALQVRDGINREIVNALVSLFSEAPISLSKNEKFFCVKYNPDIYLSNEKKISKLYRQKTFKPLIMTNYKFLALLVQLKKDSRIDAECTDFYFSDTEYTETDDHLDLKEEIKRHVVENKLDFEELITLLSDSSYSIKFVEFKPKNSTDYVTVYASGNINCSDPRDNIDLEIVLDVIEFLFTGSVTSYE